MKNKYCFYFVLLFCFVQQTFAQPYYYTDGTNTSNRLLIKSQDFLRINLQDGTKNIFYTDTINPWGNTSWDPTQQWVFIERDNSYLRMNQTEDRYLNYITTINMDNHNLTHDFPDQYPHPSGTTPHSFSGLFVHDDLVYDGIVFNPVKNVLYVSWSLPFPYSDTTKGKYARYQRTAVFDASTFTLLDTLPVPSCWINAKTSVSDDGNYLYLEKWKGGNPIAIGKYSLITKQLIINRNLSDIIIPGKWKNLYDSKKGKYLFGYCYPTTEFSDRKYALYNIDLDTSVIIPIPSRAHGSFSSDCRFIIVEETPYRSDDPKDYTVLHPGRISIYSGTTGKLLKKLSLPSDGKVLVFDNYPNMLYYYLPSEERSINIDLSKFACITSLTPSSLYAGSSAFTLTVNGKYFTNGSTVLWNGTAKATTFVSDSVLQTNILANDVAVVDSPIVKVRSADGYAESDSVRFYVKQQPVLAGYNVKLVNSTGTKLTSGSLQYYEGGWKDATNNNDGTFSVSTNLKTISLRMTYEYGTQTKSNVAISNDTVVFQTVNAQIQLQNSSGVLIDTGTVQYYAGAWRTFGPTINGIATKELLPASYSFRMTYAYASKDKQQDLSTNSTVVFQTVNTAVQLQNSQGNLIDQGTVQYYSGAWRDFGTTTNGIANKELLANNYSFRMTYAYASKDKQQDVGANPTVVFQTVNAAVQLQNSQGNLIDQGTVQYYSGAWRALGTTTNGIATKELLPNTYSFRMTYAYASKDKQQDLSANPTVVFQTVNATVQLQNSQGNLMPAPLGDQGAVQYYSGAWRDFGTTTNGVANKELLPNSYSFRMTSEYVSNDKQQDVSSNNTVIFSTVLCDVKVITLAGQLVNNATVSYYAGAWRQIGTTVNGEITKELLPANLSFRVKSGTVQQDKTQNISTNPAVVFTLQ